MVWGDEMSKKVWPRRSLEERFWEKVDKRGPNDCWEWTACKIGMGYGRIGTGGHNGRSLVTHRVSWELAYGPIPKGQCVLHHCDNPGCVNPAHLWLGTKADNTHDMMDKERQAVGEAAGNAKLTNQAVREILCLLAAGYVQREIAEVYSVSQMHISNINTGKRWAWLERPEWVKTVGTLRRPNRTFPARGANK